MIANFYFWNSILLPGIDHTYTLERLVFRTNFHKKKRNMKKLKLVLIEFPYFLLLEIYFVARTVG